MSPGCSQRVRCQSALPVKATAAAVIQLKIRYASCRLMQFPCPAQAGLATLVLAAVAPLGGLVSFRRLGLIDRFPDSWHAAIKWAHRKVPLLVTSAACC